METVGRSLVRGSSFLFFGRLFQYIFSFASVIFIVRLLTLQYGNAEPLGYLYVIAFLPSFMTFLGDFGVSYFVTNQSVKFVMQNNFEEASKLIWTAIAFVLPLYLLYSIVSYLFGGWIITYLYSKPEVAFLVNIVSIGIFISYLYGLASGICIILDKTSIYALTLALYAIFQGGFSIILLLLKYGILGVVISYYIVAPLVSSIPGLYLLFKYFKPKFFDKSKLSSSLKFGLPLAASNYLHMPGSIIYGILISRYVNSEVLGLFSVPARFSVLFDLITFPVSTLSFPSFSKLENKEDFNIVFSSMVRIIMFFALPIGISLFIFSKEFLSLFFGEYYANGDLYLKLFAITWIIGSLGGGFASNLIASKGDTNVVFKYTLVYVLTALVFNVTLIPLYGVLGALISGIFSGIPSLILTFNYLSKKYSIKYPLIQVGKNFALSFLIVAFFYGFFYFLKFFINYYASFLISLAFILLTYTFASKRFNILSNSEINFVEKSLKGIPIIDFLVSIYKRI